MGRRRAGWLLAILQWYVSHFVIELLEHLICDINSLGPSDAYMRQ